MRKALLISAAVFAGIIVSVAGAAEPHQDTLAKFLSAADQNDFPAMQNVLDDKLMSSSGERFSPAAFVAKISKCYLRRVYDDSVSKRLIATWMCDEGVGKSRVVVATVGTNGDKVQLVVNREDRNDRPAPARTGSAFAAEPIK